MVMNCSKKTNLPCSSANSHDDSQICFQKINFPIFGLEQICCGHNWLSKSKLSVLCNSPKSESNSHVDFVIPFGSMILLCQRSITPDFEYSNSCTEQEQITQLRRLFILFACG